MYRELKSLTLEQRVTVRRSEIHGWGLYLHRAVPKDGMVIEYTGEVIGQAVADKREKRCVVVVPAAASFGARWCSLTTPLVSCLVVLLFVVFCFFVVVMGVWLVPSSRRRQL